MNTLRRFALCLLTASAVLAQAQPAQAALSALDLEDAVAMVGEAGSLEEYPDANAVVILDETDVSFEESGAYVQHNHALVKILTDEGIDRNADHSIVYHRRYGEVDVLLARVIKPDGTEIVVGEDLITDGTPPQVSAMDIYETDFRERTIVFPGLEIGDAVEYVTRETYEPLIEDQFNGIYILQFIEPIQKATVTISGPSGKPLHHAVKDGDVAFTEATEGGRTLYSWVAEDSPKIEREVGMAPPLQFVTRLIVSTVPSWEELSRYGWKMTSEKCVAEESVRELVGEITDGLETTEDKIRAIHYWILENVRYLGIAMDRNMFLEPHFAAYTLEKEYGVCRDKAVLMVTMLGEIGVPAWVVFLNPSRETDPEVPNVYFEHGIVAIKGDDGSYRFIDPTMETSREVYSPYVGDRWVLVATEEGEGLSKVPHIPASANAGVITERSVLDDDGGLTGTVTITGRGMYEEILRTVAKQTGEQQIRMMAEAMVSALYPGAELTGFTLSDHSDLNEPVSMVLEYQIEGYALDADPYKLFRVPAASGEFDILSGVLFGRFVGLEERKYPIALGVTLGVEEEGIVEIPDGYSVQNFPDDVDFEQGVISLAMKYDHVPADEEGESGAVRYRRTMGIDAFQISPEDYLALKEAVRLASRSARGEVILKREEG